MRKMKMLCVGNMQNETIMIQHNKYYVSELFEAKIHHSYKLSLKKMLTSKYNASPTV